MKIFSALRHRHQWGWAIFAGLTIVLGTWLFSLVTQPPAIRRQRLDLFTENEVTVEITLEKNQAGEFFLAGLFTPVEKNFHLYSLDLPREGIDGVGRPTLLELIAAEDVATLGPLVADQPTLNFNVPILNQSFPIYPEGPVTLRLPIKLDSNGASSVPVELSVTYMVCAGVCYPPVIDKRIRVQLSRD